MVSPSTVLFLLRLAPAMAEALAGLGRALLAGDERAEREALEAARSAAFVVRQARRKPRR
jgi:hypothetical protein